MEGLKASLCHPCHPARAEWIPASRSCGLRTALLMERQCQARQPFSLSTQEHGGSGDRRSLGRCTGQKLRQRPPFHDPRQFKKNSEIRATSPEKIPIDDMTPSERVRSSLGKGPNFFPAPQKSCNATYSLFSPALRYGHRLFQEPPAKNKFPATQPPGRE